MGLGKGSLLVWTAVVEVGCGGRKVCWTVQYVALADTTCMYYILYMCISCCVSELSLLFVCILGNLIVCDVMLLLVGLLLCYSQKVTRVNCVSRASQLIKAPLKPAP